MESEHSYLNTQNRRIWATSNPLQPASAFSPCDCLVLFHRILTLGPFFFEEFCPVWLSYVVCASRYVYVCRPRNSKKKQVDRVDQYICYRRERANRQSYIKCIHNFYVYSFKNIGFFQSNHSLHLHHNK